MGCETVSVKEAAATLGISYSFARKLVATGELPAVRLGAKALRIRREDLRAVLTSRNAKR
jgi:excisionase family DNA binding protein